MKTGIRPREDLRLSGLMSSLEQIKKRSGSSSLSPLESLELDESALRATVEESVVLLGDVFQNKLVLPEFASFCDRVEAIFERCRTNQAGTVADYIPQLAKFSPDMWACSVCTVDGQRFSMGDVDTKFTMQSCRLVFKVVLTQLFLSKYRTQSSYGFSANPLRTPSV